MLNTLHAGVKVKYELLGEDASKVLQESESFETPEVMAFEEALSQFVSKTIPEYIAEHKFMFLGESQDEIAENIYTFTAYAVRGFLQELSELELVLPHLSEQVMNEASTVFENEEDIEIALQETINELIEKAENYALAKATGAYQVINEISKKGVIGALAGAATAAGAAYGAKKLADVGEEELFKKADQNRFIGSKIVGNLTGGLIGTSDEELKQQAKNASFVKKLSAGAKHLMNKIQK